MAQHYPASPDQSLIGLLSYALHSVRSTPPRIIASPPTQPRRAAVALVIRVVPPPNFPTPASHTHKLSLPEFFEQDWVNAPGARPEILFLRRGKPLDAPPKAKTTSDAHVAFPGGRMEPGDESSLYTAMRQTWEEIGLDLAEKHFLCIGALDDREVTTSLGKRLLMVLSPFVFLQLVPEPQYTDPPEGTTLHWTPLATLVARRPVWSTVTVDISSRLAPRHALIRSLIRLLVGNMRFDAVVLNRTQSLQSRSPTRRQKSAGFGHGIFDSKDYQTKSQKRRFSDASEEELKLWGLTFGIFLDFLGHMNTPLQHSSLPSPDGFIGAEMAPSMTSVFPRFSYPDVNFWIWVFGKRYREIVRGWEASVRAGVSQDRRINWTGSALQAFYAAVRKALVVIIVLRAIGVLACLGFSAWWLWRR